MGETTTKKKTAAEMLEEYKSKQQSGHTTRDEERLALQRLLASRSAHLPGYSWCADWVQWMRNNHPVFAICCKYKENPVGVGLRVVILISSIAFGLAATNLVYLFYHIFDGANGVVLSIETADGNFILTYEEIAVWTLGSLLHSLTDLGIWHLTACACCMPGACCSCCGWLRIFGRYATIAVCGIFVALGTMALIMRANYEASDGETAFNELTGLDLDISSFSFLAAYSVELALVWLCYYPIMATIFFSGAIRPILPCIGGRPKEIDRQREEKRRKMEESDDFTDDPTMA